MRRPFLSGTLPASALPALALGAGELRVSTDFPGGSAHVEHLDPAARTLRLTPTPHPGRGWACWWYFKLEGLRPGDTVTLDVGTDAFAKADRASFSLDDRTWVHTAPGTRQGSRIVYRQRVDADAAWFAWGPPYSLERGRALVRRVAAEAPRAREFELCRTAEGRAVPALRLAAEKGVGARYGVWLQARQHAWESGGSWVGEGLIEWLTSGEPRAEALRRKATFHYVPIMDADNVERGAGGKNQKPQDHNRDWTDTPHWPEVRAAQKHLIALDAVRELDLFMDLHNPAPNDRVPEFFLPPREIMTPRALRNMEAFLGFAREEMTGPLAFTGKTRESGPKYDPQWERISKNWVTRSAHGHVLALTLETAWNTPASTQEGYRRAGRELGLAMERYFRADVRAE